MKRIGILTGGGDCPGLNAVIRAVVRRAMLGHGWEVYGIHEGFRGLVDGAVEPMTLSGARGLLQRGGTVLGATNKRNPFCWPAGPGEPPLDRSDEVIERARALGIEALVVVGGD